MYKLSGIISVVILAVIVVIVLFFFKKVRRKYVSLGVYLLCVFVYELSMLVTSMNGINNHLLANLHSLFYMPVTCWVLITIYKRTYRVNISMKKPLFIITLMITIAWVVENFMAGSVMIFNPIVPVISAVLVSLVCIYLLNILLFVGRRSGERQADIFVLTGCMVRSVLFGFMLWLFNFHTGYEREFYTRLLALINTGLCISDVFFLMAVLTTIGSRSVQNRKAKAVVR